jgi:hypothetical protein
VSTPGGPGFNKQQVQVSGKVSGEAFSVSGQVRSPIRPVRRPYRETGPVPVKNRPGPLKTVQNRRTRPQNLTREDEGGITSGSEEVCDLRSEDSGGDGQDTSESVCILTSSSGN